LSTIWGWRFWQHAGTCIELRRLGIACNLSTDLDFLRRLKRCDAVVLGSDAVLLDERIANRSGTSPLVERTYELGIGCYFMTDRLKLDLEECGGTRPQPSERSSSTSSTSPNPWLT
jgi:translation initiation factor 2B subunit (eIF-2B alpha/beta/delta family)